MTRMGRLGAELEGPRNAPDVRSIDPQDDGPFRSAAADHRQPTRPHSSGVAARRRARFGCPHRVEFAFCGGAGAFDFYVLYSAGRSAVRLDPARAALVP